VSNERPVLSVVVPVYYNEGNLRETVPALLALQDKIGPMEVVLVDDGSEDGSYTVMEDLQRQHPAAVTLVKLTRNFGSMAAILAGLSVARGQCVGMIAADLQDPPELFVGMHGAWRQGHKAVFAVRADRVETGFNRWAANTYYALMRRFALAGYPRGGFDYFLIDRQVVEEVVKIGEKNTNLMSLVFWLGFPAKLIPYVRGERKYGRSRWTLAKKVKLFVDSFAAFSYAPVRVMSLLGVVVSLGAFGYAAFIIAYSLFHGMPVAGFSTLASLVALLSGLQMLMLGILGEYLWRTLDETRRRPPFVIDLVKRTGGSDAQS
jgi:glycosyltransferase involved in cell wall biosynthesis